MQHSSSGSKRHPCLVPNMAPKSAKKAAKAKPKPQVTKGLTKVKSKAKATGKKAALAKTAQCQEPDPSSDADMDTGASGSAGPTPAQYKQFNRALSSAPSGVQEAVAHVMKLGYGQQKTKRYQEMVLAFQAAGWDHELFNVTETLESGKYLKEASHCLPKAIMVGKCGGLVAFEDGLRSGDILEVRHPQEPNKVLYRYSSFQEGTKTSTTKTVKLTKDKDMEGQAFSFDDVDLSWGLEATARCHC